MDKIDPRLMKALDEGASTVDVVIVCSDDCSGALAELTTAGVAPRTGAAEMGLVSATVSKDVLTKIAKAPGVTAIEPDETAFTQ